MLFKDAHITIWSAVAAATVAATEFFRMGRAEDPEQSSYFTEAMAIMAADTGDAWRRAYDIQYLMRLRLSPQPGV